MHPIITFIIQHLINCMYYAGLMETAIKSTTFTIQFVVEKILAQLDKKFESLDVKDVINGFEIDNITDSAFISSIYRIRIDWKPCLVGSVPSSVVLKVPDPHMEHWHDYPNAEIGETEKRFIESAYASEIEFYRMFPSIEPNLKLPKFYYGQNHDFKRKCDASQGCEIMEDMTTNGSVANVLPGFKHEQVLALIDEIAKYHSISWKHPEWKEIIGENTFDQQFFEEMKRNVLALKPMNPDIFGPLLERISPIFEHHIRDNTRGGDYDQEKIGIPACIVHGDLWAPNVIWFKDSEGRPTSELAAIIDWQTIHSGNPCEDLCRILNLNTTGEYRRQNTENIMKYYMERIKEHAGNGVTFSFDQLKQAYKSALPSSALYLAASVQCLLFPTVISAQCQSHVDYYFMDSIVGRCDEDRRKNRDELLSRVAQYFEDTIEAYNDHRH